MADAIIIDKTLTDEEKYKTLIPQIESLMDNDLPAVTNMSNFVAAIFNTFEKVSWCGFYLARYDKLYLGPFQGNTACTVINPGKGVCGTSFSEKETIIVEDVDKFPGHIACDAGSKSEIVLPVFAGNDAVGVLDLDSYEYASFNKTDKKYLLELLNILSEKVDFNNFNIS